MVLELIPAVLGVEPIHLTELRERSDQRRTTCPLRVKSRHLQRKTACPLYPWKRTCTVQ